VDHDGKGFTSPGSIPGITEMAGRLIHFAKDGIDLHSQVGGKLDREGLLRQQVRAEMYERFMDGVITEDEHFRELRGEPGSRKKH
jgi:hypothetical protein